MEPVPGTKRALDMLLREGDTDAAAALLRMGRRAREILPECVGLSLGLLADDLTFTLVASGTEAAGPDAAACASTLSLPIVRSGRIVGAVYLYGATPDAFTGHHQELARALGASAEGAVANADLEFSTRQLAAEAPARLEDQADIDIALGIIAGSKGADIATAERQLRQAAARAGVGEAQAARVFRYLGCW